MYASCGQRSATYFLPKISEVWAGVDVSETVEPDRICLALDMRNAWTSCFPFDSKVFPRTFLMGQFFCSPSGLLTRVASKPPGRGKNCKIALLRKIRLLQNFGNFQSSRVSPLQSSRLARRQVPKPFKLTGLHHFIGYLMDQSEGSDHEGKQAGRRSRSGSEGIDR